ncbi:hypothetical protein [Mycobacterium sp. SM1]|uniref:hypothetical protein n=1 Tax=Mycobacterium sp. SM1 TaxID=2816243 RepID=UPI001F392CEF|nr:hypothetical protein [Mycobacterium sp. SM1]
MLVPAGAGHVFGKAELGQPGRRRDDLLTDLPSAATSSATRWRMSARSTAPCCARAACCCSLPPRRVSVTL